MSAPYDGPRKGKLRPRRRDKGPCKSFLETGTCRFGDRCQYPHVLSTATSGAMGESDGTGIAMEESSHREEVNSAPSDQNHMNASTRLMAALRKPTPAGAHTGGVNQSTATFVSGGNPAPNALPPPPIAVPASLSHAPTPLGVLGSTHSLSGLSDGSGLLGATKANHLSIGNDSFGESSGHSGFPNSPSRALFSNNYSFGSNDGTLFGNSGWSQNSFFGSSPFLNSNGNDMGNSYGMGNSLNSLSGGSGGIMGGLNSQFPSMDRFGMPLGGSLTGNGTLGGIGSGVPLAIPISGEFGLDSKLSQLNFDNKPSLPGNGSLFGAEETMSSRLARGARLGHGLRGNSAEDPNLSAARLMNGMNMYEGRSRPVRNDIGRANGDMSNERGGRRKDVGNDAVRSSDPSADVLGHLEKSMLSNDSIDHPATDSTPPNTDAAAVTDETAAPKKAILWRIVKNQRSFLEVLLHQKNDMGRLDDIAISNGYLVRPGYKLRVRWQIPVSVLRDLPSNAQLALGLVRYGNSSNTLAIVAKKLSVRCGIHAEMNDIQPVESFTPYHYNSDFAVTRRAGPELVATGVLPVLAPKSAGQFVFRLYDSSTKESSMETLGTSASFTVSLVDSDIAMNLKYVLESFDDGLTVKAATQLALVVRGMKSCGSHAMNDTSDVLQKVLRRVLEAVDSYLPTLDKGCALRNARATNSEEDLEEGVTPTVEGEDPTLTAEQAAAAVAAASAKDKAFWKDFRTAEKFHWEVHDALSLLCNRRLSLSLTPDAWKDRVRGVLKRFCPVLRRFYASESALHEARFKTFGFQPSLLDAQLSHSASLSVVDRCIENLLPTLLPNDDFDSTRDSVRIRLEKLLLNAGLVPPGTTLGIYGSSGNNFGAPGADVDMCLLIPPGPAATALASPEEKARLIERMHNYFVTEDCGVMEVTVRPTARIPIMQFVDIETGLHCDISVDNALALKNTQLLWVYSMIDPRIRSLAYIVKHWAKSRNINSPTEGTLSSYGYILMLIAFLQNRPDPLIPSLQQLPPNWVGGPYQPFHTGGKNFNGNNNSHLPIQLTHNADGLDCNSYYFSPQSDAQWEALRNFAAGNKESVATLLLEFFRYYAWQVDYRSHVISIRSGRPNYHVAKLDKAEHAGWNASNLLSIEDPFETWYDVAHVIKAPQMVHIQKEFLRAFSLASRMHTGDSRVSEEDCLPLKVNPEDFLTHLCENAPVVERRK